MSISSSGLARTVRVAASAATALAVLITPIAPAFAQDASSTPDTGTASSTEPTISTLDTTAPVITLNGDATVNLSVGDTWTDPSATATDNIDGTDPVAIGGDTVDTKTAGTYVITYDAADKAGNAATQVTRTVVVSAASDDTASTTDDNSGGGPKGGIKTFSLFSAPLLATTSAPAISGFTQDGNALACGTTTDTNGTSPNTTHMQWTESSSGIQQYEIFPTYPDGIGEHQYFIPGTALDVWIGDNFTHHGEGTYSYVIRAQGSDGSWSDNSASCSLTYSTTPPPPVPPTPATVVVSPSAMNGWYFYNDLSDSVLTPDADHGFTTGPGTPLGTGSAHFTKTTTDRYGIATPQFAGTPLADITALSFSTYRTNGTSAQAPSLGFDVDSDTTDGDTSYQGRLTYEPYFTQTVDTGAWQNWNTLDDSAGTGTGNWWFSHATLSGGAASQCTQSNPCTWSELLHDYPHASMRSPGQLILRTNGADGEAFDGNVDDLHIATANADTTYNFDPDAVVTPPAPTLAITAPAADGDTASGTYDFTADYENGVTTSLQWAVRTDPSCNTGTVAGNVDGHTDASSLTGTDFSAALDTTAWTNGSYCLVVNDGHGNRVQRHFAVDNAVPDTEAPVVTVTPDSSTVLHGSETFTITVSDNEPLDPSKNTHVWVYLYNNGGTQKHAGANVDLSSGTGTFTVDTTLLDDGTSTLDVGRVEDAAGNWSGTGDNYFKNYVIDNTGPTVSVVPAAGSTLSGTVTFTVTVSDPHLDPSALGHIWTYLYNNLPPQASKGASLDLSSGTATFTVDTTQLANGTSTLDVGKLYDALGNPSGAGDSYFKNYVIDNVPPDTTRPTLAFNLPATASSTATSTLPVSVTATDGGSGLKSLIVHVYNASGTLLGSCGTGDNALAGTASDTYTCTLDTSSYADGSYSLRAGTFDVAGNNQTVSLPFVVDKTRPNATITAPADSAALASGDFTITGTATDNLSGIDHILVYVSKVASGGGFGGYAVDGASATWDAGTGTFTYDATGIADGTYIVKADAFDKAGNNHFASPSPTITIDSAAPAQPAITSPADGSTLTTATWNDVTWTDVSDAGTPITYVYQSATDPSTNPDGSFANPAYTSGSLTTTSQATTGTPAGTYYVHVKAADAAGNSVWSDPIEVIVDNTSGAGHPTNNAPVADDQSVSVGENGTLGIVLTGSDADGDTLSFATTSSPVHGTLTGSAPNLTYTPDADFMGTDSFTFVTNDGAEDSAPATVTIAVNAADSSVPSGTFVITPSAMQGWATSTATGAGADFVTDDTSPNGVGALQLTTGSDNDSVAHMTSPSFNMPLADVSSLSYATKVVAVPDAQKAVGNATLRVMIDTTGDGVADDELMYEPYYNGFDGTTMTGWQTWAITPSSGKFWSNETNSYNSLGGVGAGSYASNFTLADVLHDYPNAHVVGLVLSMGTWNDSQTVEADNLQINGTTQYSFEPDAAPSNGNGGGSVQPLFFSRGSSGSGGSSGQTINSGGGEVLGASTYNFTRDLHLGSTGDDVVVLQQFLISSGYPISAGATGYFGLQTQAALAKFQSDHGITPALGYFGPITRALVNSGTIETTPVTQNQESVQQQINDLLAKLAALRAQLNAASTTP